MLQPVLDRQLPSYRPRRNVRLTGTFKGASSDVLTTVVQKLFDKFRGYHPGVTLTIAPPYAGSYGAAELVKEKLDFVFVSRELRPDDIREVLKVLHHLGVVERLVDEEPGARGIDGQALSRRGAMTQRGNDHGREDKTEPIHGWIPRAVLLRYAPSSCRVRSEKGGGGPAEPPRP